MNKPMSRQTPTSAFSGDTPAPGRGGAFDRNAGEGDMLPPAVPGAVASSTDAGGIVPEGGPSEGGIGFPGYRPPAPSEEVGGRRSALLQAFSDTFRQRGAKIGAVWVTILVILAVFAPFLANSRPLVARWADGSITSPLLTSLAPVDVTLLVTFLAALAMLLVNRFVMRLAPREVVATVAWVMCVTIVASGWYEAGLYAGRYFADGFTFFSWSAQRFIWGAAAAVLVVGAGIVIPLFLVPSRLLLPVGLLMAVLIGLTIWKPINPPRLVEWDQWRQLERSGELKSAIHTIVPFSPNDAMADLRAAFERPQQPPSKQNWLGTTVFGEDMLSRMIHATRVALAIGFIATGIAVIIGVVIGSIMGYFAGWTDLLMMRFIEIVEVIPQLILLIIVTSFFGKNIWLMMITIGLIAWTSNARFIRAEFLKLRRQDFVQACVATGLPLKNILFRHMLPNGIAPVLVNASFGIAGAILLESVLSFLGLGLEQTESSWGALLNQAREGGSGFNWWIATFPGLAIFLTVFAYILIGEAMRDAIDPKLRKAGE